VFSFAQINWRDTTRRLSDTCKNLQKGSMEKTLPGTNHSMFLIIANGIVISGDEIKKKRIDSISVIKCPQSFTLFGNIGAFGVLKLKTRQKFDTVRITNVVNIEQSHSAQQKVVYAINGYLFADTTLSLSKKAVKRVEILKNFKHKSLNGEEFICVSIWTMKEKKKK
jgi:hypothetical protein